MQTTFDKLSSTDARLKVEIIEADYKPEVDKKIKEYSKTASVKGFRPGHVPVQYIKKIYGKGILVDEVIKQTSKAVNDYIAENKLKVVGDPIPLEDSYKIDWDTQNNYTFEYEVGMASDFAIEVENLPAIVNYEIEPSEKQIEDSIIDLQKRFGNETEPEAVEIGDLVFGKLVQESSEFEFQSGIPTDKVVEDSQKLFVGLEKDSSIKFDIRKIFASVKELGFATGKSDEEAEALTGEFEFTVDKITRIAPSEIDQAFFDKVLGEGKATEEAEFRKQLTEIIKSNYSREAGFLLDFDIEKSLIDNVVIELPNEFLKKWLLQVNDGKFTQEDIDREYDAYARGLRLDLIKTEIAQKHDLKVEYADVLEEVKSEIRGYFGQQGGFEGMEDFIENMAKKQLADNKNETFRKYFDKAFGRKVVTFLKEKIKIENKSVFVEEFNQIASEKYQVA
jgi:trigger factor